MASTQPNAWADEAGAAGLLDLHEELSTAFAEDAPAAVAGRCVCGPAHLLLRSEHGELVRPRGGSVNRCDYCAKLAAVENCEMLALDAAEGDPATVLLVLTTRTVAVDLAAFSRGLAAVIEALRFDWGDRVEYACLVEFTTGYAGSSGGHRRPHWNLMLKGVPADYASDVHRTAAAVWCAEVDAAPAAQHATPIYAGEGLTRYLALHFQKASQEPPAGFRGQRFNCSRGYFTGATRATARRRARESLQLKREVWRQVQREDADAPTNPYDVELNAQLAYRLACSTRWTLASGSGGRLGKEPFAPTTIRHRIRRTVAMQREATRRQLDGDWLPARDLVLVMPGHVAL